MVVVVVVVEYYECSLWFIKLRPILNILLTVTDPYHCFFTRAGILCMLIVVLAELYCIQTSYLKNTHSERVD